MAKSRSAFKSVGALTVAALLMLLSAAFRIWAYWDLDILSPTKFIIQQAWVPLACNFLFVILVLAFGRRNLIPTVLPVIIGCVFFVFRIIEPATGVAVGTWHIALCCCLYTLVGTLYTLTITGVIRPKWPLILVFALPLAYHILEAIYVILTTGAGVFELFTLPEISVDLIMAALLVTACGLRRK